MFIKSKTLPKKIVNSWITTCPIIIIVREMLSEEIQLNTKIPYCECTPGVRQLHLIAMQFFKEKIGKLPS